MYPGFARGLGWRGRRMCFNNSDNSSIADSAIVPARTQTHSFNFLRHVTPNLLPFLVSFMWLLLCFAATAFSVAALTIVFAFSHASTQKLIALRPSNYACACCQNGL